MVDRHHAKNSSKMATPQAHTALLVGALASLATYIVSKRSSQRHSHPRIDLFFVLAGQSNMAGRGPLSQRPPPEPVDAELRKRILALGPSQRWDVADEPLHWDKPGPKQGVGPGLSFALEVARALPTATIGLVPTAVGGSELARWEPTPSGDLLHTACSRLRTALRDAAWSRGDGASDSATDDDERSGPHVTVLWHQGESDCGNVTDAETYTERVRGTIARLRAVARAGGARAPIPFVVGQLGDFISDGMQARPALFAHAQTVRAAIASLPAELADTGPALYVSSEGLAHKGDHLHFNTAAQLELGRRYAAVWLQWWREK